MIRAGILVGHYGSGTGASFNTRDEFELAAADAFELARQLERDGLIAPSVIVADQTLHPWDLVQKISRISPPSFLGGWGNIDLRAEWAIRDGVDVALEFHLNRSRLNDWGLVEAEGHEVFIRRKPGLRTRRLGEILLEEMNVLLGNRNRGLKEKNFRILRKLHAANIPAALLEPAFLAERVIGSSRWRAQYIGAIKGALYRYFNLGG
jgi:N-acetylmuramoyl-L-alanine amidase